MAKRQFANAHRQWPTRQNVFQMFAHFQKESLNRDKKIAPVKRLFFIFILKLFPAL